MQLFLKLGQADSSHFFSFSNILAMHIPLSFHITFKEYCLYLKKSKTLIENTWNLCISLGRVCIFCMVNVSFSIVSYSINTQEFSIQCECYISLKSSWVVTCCYPLLELTIPTGPYDLVYIPFIICSICSASSQIANVSCWPHLLFLDLFIWRKHLMWVSLWVQR